MSEPLQPSLCQTFNAAFIAPFASHHWQSARGRSHWVESELWQDAMAGPLSSIAKTGGCAYVYPRNDSYFAGVNDPAGLRARLLEWHAGLADAVKQFEPANPAEAADLAFMWDVVARMRELVEQALAVELARWKMAASDVDHAG